MAGHGRHSIVFSLEGGEPEASKSKLDEERERHKAR